MAGQGFRPVYHPAGHDHALRNAVQDLRTGRWVAMARLLGETTDWDSWTRRTQVLAAVAAGTDVVHTWRAEQPDSLAATVMHSRVAVERAVRAHRAGHPRTRELWQEAGTACREATDLAPADPVPWVGLIALAALDGRQRMAEHRLSPPAPMLPPGPWGLLAEAEKRDPYNREAHHRMLQFVYARRPGPLSEAVNYAHWAASSAPVGSALHVLPLYVRVERYRRERGHERALDLHWVAEDAVRDARRMGGFGNFAISFSVISVLSGCMTLYGFGMGAGGPAVMLWGWAGVGLFVLCVGLALAEVTSAYPTSGALYYMADRLGGRRWGWYTGWLNLLGLLGAIACIDNGAALFNGAFINLQWGF
ncbi:amino acid permease, partial [Streptomyces albidoflavus]